MDIFVRNMEGAVARHGLLVRERPVVVAVSGGADSVALLAALVDAGYQCVAAHCNFHLRGEESNRDMRFVEGLCRDLGVDLYVKDFDVEARRRGTGESVEMAARELRYEWFGELIERLRAQAVAVAHHREDAVETFFMNLMRGSSIAGLAGISRRNGHVVRPLLDATRGEIEEYLRRRELGFVTDSTNAHNDFSRNRLRNVVLPEIERQFPGAFDGIARSIGLLEANRAFYAEAMAERVARYSDGLRIQLARLVAQERDPALVLFEALKPLGFNATQVENILASADRSGLTFTAGATTLELSHGEILVRADGAQMTADAIKVSLRSDVVEPVSIQITEHDVAEFRPSRDKNVAYFDARILDGEPQFVVRRWRRGDRMTPFGMQGSRKVSDIFSDAHFTADAKRRAWVLTRNGEIIWLIGIRAAAQFAVTPDTRRYLRCVLKA